VSPAITDLDLWSRKSSWISGEVGIAGGLVQPAPNTADVRGTTILNLPAERLERRTEPRELIGIDAAEHAGVDRDEREAVGLDLEVGRLLKPGGHLVLAAQPRRLRRSATRCGRPSCW
jgi:hypothetical protein